MSAPLRLLLGVVVGLVLLAGYTWVRSSSADASQSPAVANLPPSPASSTPLPSPNTLVGAPPLDPSTLPTLAGSAPPRAPSPVLRRLDLLVAENGLRSTFAAAGLSDSILDELDNAFLGRYDLFAQLTLGRHLTLWFDRDILMAAEVETNFGLQRAARYRGERAKAGWYDARGLSLMGPLLGRPVQLSRITSKFGERFHPITGNQKKHNGVDYGVPVGTPVSSAGAGVVREAGVSESAGRFLKVTHEGGWESWYLHLSRFGPGVAKNSPVTQGQLIAYSGDTGASTGPHLHYEMRIANIAMDPQKTLPLPSLALGPLSLPAHQAFLRSLP